MCNYVVVKHETITQAKRAQRKLERTRSSYELAQRERSEAFRAALNAGSTERGLAAELGLSANAIHKVVSRQAP